MAGNPQISGKMKSATNWHGCYINKYWSCCKGSKNDNYHLHPHPHHGPHPPPPHHVSFWCLVAWRHAGQGIIKHCNVCQTLPTPSNRPWTQRRCREFDPTYWRPNLSLEVVERMAPENHPFSNGTSSSKPAFLGYMLVLMFEMHFVFLSLSSRFLVDLQSAHLTGKALLKLTSTCNI